MTELENTPDPSEGQKPQPQPTPQQSQPAPPQQPLPVQPAAPAQPTQPAQMPAGAPYGSQMPRNNGPYGTPGQYPTAPYQQQPRPMNPGPTPYVPQVSKPLSGLAIASMVVGIVSVVFFFLTWVGLIIALAGLGLGIAAVVMTGDNKAKRGRGFGIAGIVTSAVGAVVSLLFTMLVIVGIASWQSSYNVSRYDDYGYDDDYDYDDYDEDYELDDVDINVRFGIIEQLNELEARA